ncbi:Bug family tripartite tricarboxylate transporter substrate binding protein [Pseudorhodoplanes sp.]|uniref:Bug family tripartite tricarboxylate transporter substrate binding protein n=1 Tax=Pseudorhodoplanes sp. TaxID=1934341 RepID=UPI00391D84AC
MITRTAALLVAAGIGFGPAQAQDWPQRPVTMVVSAAAGGPIDVFGRIMAERMGQVLGQQVVIENVPGAGGMIGGSRVAKAAPDGYTALLGTIATHAHSQTLYKKPLYSATADFAPVNLIAEIPLVLIARKDLPVNSLEEFVAYAKANQGKMNFGSAGAGSATHLGCILLNQALATNIQHVPYKGTGPAMQDLQAGRIDFLCEIIVTAVPQIEAGTVKAIATLSRDRSPVLPDLPTAFEKGFKDIQAYTWTALFFPKDTPAPIVGKMRDAALKTMADPKVRQQLQKLGATIVSDERTTPDYLGKFVQSEIDKWAGPIKASGAVVDQ